MPIFKTLAQGISTGLSTGVNMFSANYNPHTVQLVKPDYPDGSVSMFNY